MISRWMQLARRMAGNCEEHRKLESGFVAD